MPAICPEPTDWRDLQEQVARILAECGMDTAVEKPLELVRGTKNIDVYAEDNDENPSVTYVCECKHWQGSVPKEVVHSVRTVVSDCGANWGFVISKTGFQRVRGRRLRRRTCDC